MLTMIGGVAEFFSDQLGVRVKKGLHQRAREGRQNGDVPFGYLRCREGLGCPPDGHPYDLPKWQTNRWGGRDGPAGVAGEAP